MNPHAVDVATGLRAVLERRLEAAEAAFERWRAGSDPEALHDFRVALRRMRSLMQAFAPDVRVERKALRSLKRLGRLTNAGRDLEVAVAWVAAAREGVPEAGQAAVAAFLAALEERRAAAQGRLRERLPRRWKKARKRLRRALDALVPRRRVSFAQAGAERIGEAADGLRLALAEVQGPADEAGLHRARLRAKRLRYLIEPYRDAVASAPAALRELKALQTVLGEIHDLHVLRAQLEAAMAQECRERAGQLAEAAYEGRDEPWCPPALMPLMRRLGELFRTRYGRLADFLAPSARWHGEAASVAAALAEPRGL